MLFKGNKKKLWKRLYDIFTFQLDFTVWGGSDPWWPHGCGRFPCKQLFYKEFKEPRYGVHFGNERLGALSNRAYTGHYCATHCQQGWSKGEILFMDMSDFDLEYKTLINYLIIISLDLVLKTISQIKYSIKIWFFMFLLFFSTPLKYSSEVSNMS